MSDPSVGLQEAKLLDCELSQLVLGKVHAFLRNLKFLSVFDQQHLSWHEWILVGLNDDQFVSVG